MAIGCGPRTIEPVVQPTASAPPARLDWSDWGLALSRIVHEDRVDYRRLQEDPAPLDRFLAMSACVGPDSTPDQFADREARLAYAINCYNAMMVRSVLALDRQGKLPTHAPFDLESRYEFRIDGQSRSPGDLRRLAEVLAEGDWRVRLTLCDGTVEGPPLWRRVYLPEMLDAQLTYVARSALTSPEVVRIDHGLDKRLLLWRGIYEIRDGLVQDYERRHQTNQATMLNVLGEWSNRTRREELNSAIGYAVAPIPRDDRINHFEPPSEASGILSIFSGLPGS
ncbi:MAG TPA: DUF547 domain-containing protein [Phycisphaerae bacterium]|nr:DUF547 domain-containing protein [Phycisphaerae bacterium]